MNLVISVIDILEKYNINIANHLILELSCTAWNTRCGLHDAYLNYAIVNCINDDECQYYYNKYASASAAVLERMNSILIYYDISAILIPHSYASGNLYLTYIKEI